jgi:hypothetical protein
MKNFFAGRGQTWLALVIAIAAVWLPVLFADPMPTNKTEWLARIVASLGVLSAAIGRGLGSPPKEEST